MRVGRLLSACRSASPAEAPWPEYMEMSKLIPHSGWIWIRLKCQHPWQVRWGGRLHAADPTTAAKPHDPTRLHRDTRAQRNDTLNLLHHSNVSIYLSLRSSALAEERSNSSPSFSALSRTLTIAHLAWTNIPTHLENVGELPNRLKTGQRQSFHQENVER